MTPKSSYFINKETETQRDKLPCLLSSSREKILGIFIHSLNVYGIPFYARHSLSAETVEDLPSWNLD